MSSSFTPTSPSSYLTSSESSTTTTLVALIGQPLMTFIGWITSSISCGVCKPTIEPKSFNSKHIKMFWST